MSVLNIKHLTNIDLMLGQHDADNGPQLIQCIMMKGMSNKLSGKLKLG